MQTINSPDSGAALFCYFVIMEANYDPYTVTERFQKLLIDSVFDAARHELLDDKKKNQNDAPDSAIHTNNGKVWSHISY